MRRKIISVTSDEEFYTNFMKASDFAKRYKRNPDVCDRDRSYVVKTTLSQYIKEITDPTALQGMIKVSYCRQGLYSNAPTQNQHDIEVQSDKEEEEYKPLEKKIKI